MVEDHAAARGTGARDIDTLHRIEARTVKAEVIAAGFVFVAESKVLRNSRDPHTGNAHDLHDNTDRFVLKFPNLESSLGAAASSQRSFNSARVARSKRAIHRAMCEA